MNGNRFAVQKPTEIGWDIAAGAISAGVRGYTALQTMANAKRGDSVLILEGGIFEQKLLIQLASLWNLTVITTSRSEYESESLKCLNASISKVIELDKENLLDSLMEETSHLGVDIIIEPANLPDNLIFDTETLIKCLTFSGSLISSRNLQVFFFMIFLARIFAFN